MPEIADGSSLGAKWHFADLSVIMRKCRRLLQQCTAYKTSPITSARDEVIR